jgi:integrase/recombinase XerD
MTIPQNSFESYYPIEWVDSVHSSQLPLVFPLHDGVNFGAEFVRKMFAPSAGALYVYRPSKKRRVLNRAIDKLEESSLPGYEYAISHLCDKYRRNLTISTISQTGRVMIAFLSFFQELERVKIEEISRKDIAEYVEHLHDLDLTMTTVKNYLRTVYAFLQYLVDNEILPPDILQKKIIIKLPEVLPRAIPAVDLEQILAAVKSIRDRALILLLLHTGMRIGELLKVKMTDVILSERKILLSLGEKNFQGRVVYYNSEAEQALEKWLETRTLDSEYLFYGYAGGKLSYVGAWMIMRKALKKSGLEHKEYSLHSLRHTFATDMLNAGLRLEVLQQLLGHMSIDITLRYARMSNRTREDEYFKAMAIIEKGDVHEHQRVNSVLQAVFEEKKLCGAHR